MYRIILALVLMISAGCASAQNCPEFYRFVDFGLRDSDGQFLRGGPLYRAESFAGTSLLAQEETQCRAVSDIAIDGHANPIPVVASITYNVERLTVDLTELQISFAENTNTTASQSADLHRERLKASDSIQINSQNSLCVVLKDGPAISCQVFSLYPGNVDLVIYCDRALCKMPVLAVTKNIQIAATWAVDGSFFERPNDAAEGILAKVQDIYDFLKPLASGI